MRRRKVSCGIEPENCMRKEAFLRLFPKDGAVWDARHAAELALFHKYFRTYWGRVSLGIEIREYPHTFRVVPDNKGFWAAAYDPTEVSEKEYRFIQRQIARIRKPFFEINDCLTKEAYLTVYDRRSDEGYEKDHVEQLELFHEYFATRRGRKRIKEEFTEAVRDHLDLYLTGFDTNEFSEKEYRFLMAQAARLPENQEKLLRRLNK